MRRVLVDGRPWLVDDVSAEAMIARGHAESVEPVEPDGFDPSAHTVEQVLEHLASASEDEAARVLAAEASGRARKGVLAATGVDEI